MNEYEITAIVIGAVIAVGVWAVYSFFRSNPCFVGCDRKHLSIEKRSWPTCPRSDHAYHGDKPVYITKWICARPDCGEMGYYCVGEVSKGAWTIQHGKIVPDEKEWMKWD